MTSWRILCGDVREQLATLDAGSVRTCVTSPPYWGLRDYGVSGQLGLEATPEGYVDAMVGVFREVKRVLSDDGTLWLNLGDSYFSIGGQRTYGSSDGETGRADAPKRRGVVKWQSGGGSNFTYVGLGGQKAKDIVGIPWMVAFALRADGWYLRSDIIWSKPNPMPESVTDRPTKAHEYIFLLAKSKSYYYDHEAIKTKSDRAGEICGTGPKSLSRGSARGQNVLASGNAVAGGFVISPEMSNKRSVWHVATQPYPEAHFATYPEALIEPCILAGSAVGDTVLDPFTGSGTTGAVAIRHQRHFIGTELNPAYVELARKRIGAVAPLLAREVA